MLDTFSSRVKRCFDKYAMVLKDNDYLPGYHRNCKEGRIPSSNSGFWKEKLERNIKKDAYNIKILKQKNWKVFVIWECEIEKQFEKSFKRLVNNIEKNSEV